MKWDVINLDNTKVGDIDLDDTVFGVEVRRDIMARAINWQLSRRQAGTHKTKGRSEVSGTSKKPYKQKGTGRARQGTMRAPHMRGGGIVFGPLPRSHAFDLPKKVRRLALRSALSAKRDEGKLVIIEEAAVKETKTAALAKQLKALGWGATLVIDGETVNADFLRAAGNIMGIDVLPSQGANVYDIMRRDTLVLTRNAVEKLVERLK